MRRIISLILALLLMVGLVACGHDSNQEVIDRSREILDDIERVQEKSDYVSGLIDDYKNGK